MHEALVSDCVTTKRDIFYKDPELFFRQSVVDRYVDDIAHTFDVPRALLNVVAAAKGLVIGPLKLKRKDGSELNCGSQSEGTLIPNIDDLEPIQNLDVEWILVVEKEVPSLFLVKHQYSNIPLYLGQQILGVLGRRPAPLPPQPVSAWPYRSQTPPTKQAKGYPDLSSRAFLRFLTQPARPTNHDYHSKPAPTLPLPVFGLVDFDPDGLAILSTYKYGSHNMAHENAALNVPRMQWLGIRSHDLLAPRPGTDSYEGIQHQRPHYSSSASAHDGGSGILKLTARDRNRATKMLEWEILAQDGPETEWRRELQVMLVLNVKAEIQVLWEAEEGLLGWLERMLLMAS
ncbi:MAG: hypothetical protein M1819_005709 [Sarea resinae]|nr:MAG: hypothetical protein M1819_005709 [Sarea resinae]